MRLVYIPRNDRVRHWAVHIWGTRAPWWSSCCGRHSDGNQRLLVAIYQATYRPCLARFPQHPKHSRLGAAQYLDLLAQTSKGCILCHLPMIRSTVASSVFDCLLCLYTHSFVPLFRWVFLLFLLLLLLWRVCFNWMISKFIFCAWLFDICFPPKQTTICSPHSGRMPHHRPKPNNR